MVERTNTHTLTIYLLALLSSLFEGKLETVVLCFQVVIRDSSASHYVVTVGSHNFYKPYNVRIQSFNPRGEGPMSPEVTIMSAEERKYKNVQN